jgi:hypothetical protein
MFLTSGVMALIRLHFGLQIVIVVALVMPAFDGLGRLASRDLVEQ